MSTTKKRHHYIPQTYLEGFCVSDEVPRVFEYRKHDGTPPRLDTPYNLAVERYYYAFDKKEGKDTNTLEDMFSIAEAPYKDIVARIMSREIFYPEDIDNLATFIALMRVRMPNFRMQYEQGRAELSKITAMVASKHDKELNEKHAALVAAAEAKGDTKGVEALHRIKQEMERGEITVSVNQQISLVAIDYFRGIYERLKQLKWGFFTSDCRQDFITGDNPTLWHDTKIKDFFPYRNGYANPDVQFVFPLNKKILVLANNFFKQKVGYGTLPKKWVHTFNRAIAMSAERYVYASQDHLGQMIGKYKDIVPIQEHYRIKEGTGYLQAMRPGLGKPHKLPKWETEEA